MTGVSHSPFANHSGGLSASLRVTSRFILLLCATVGARVPYPVDSSYADTVRVGIMANYTAVGTCQLMPAVGPQTLEFVLAALDTTHLANIRVVEAQRATMDTVLAMFPGKLPHVLVHINAGWATGVGRIAGLLDWAVGYNIGIVEIGDDDLEGLDSMFTWMSSAPRWGPMSTATWFNTPADTLSIRLQPGSDTIVDRSVYPHLTGIVRNAADSILRDSTLYFMPYSDSVGRCESDPDVYAIDTGKEHLVHALAFQQGYNDTCDTLTFSPDETCSTLVGMPGEWNVISVFQDTIDIGGAPGLRRAVSLSTQPQFLQETTAVQQIIYDAVMYASTVHLDNPPTPEVRVRGGGVTRAARSGDLRSARVQIVDLRGRVVYEGVIDSKDRLRKMAARWPAGRYALTIVAEGKRWSAAWAVVR